MTTALETLDRATDVDPWRRRADLAAALGFKVEAFEASAGDGGFSPVSQVIASHSLYLYAGEVVTNVLVCVYVVATGAPPTLLKLGLWEWAGVVCRAVTADLSGDAAWTGTTGYKVFPLTAPYTVAASGIHMLAVLKNGAFAGTDVQLLAGVPSAAPANGVPGFPRRFARLGTGRTDMNPGDTAALSAGTAAIWFALS